MGYEDRDYFRAKPKFEMSLGMPPGTKGLLIAILSAYIVMVFATDQLDLFSESAQSVFAGKGTDASRFVLDTLVLWPGNVFPFFDPGPVQPWKLLVSWIVPPSILRVILALLMTYFGGKMLEELFGTRQYLMLFIGGSIGANLLACLLDPLLMGDRVSLVMGPTGGIFATLVTMIWIAPNERGLLGVRTKPMIVVLLALFGGIALLSGLTGEESIAGSPTQLLLGAGIGALVMKFLQAKGRVPQFAKGEAVDKSEASAGMRKFQEVVRQQAQDDEKQRAERDREKQQFQKDATELDRILAKISDKGIDSLSRKEKKFLDSRSKSK
ncbi:MAG: rhomboid family intramembrane serine protease [Planctomycetota bacterium]|jgi:membrane associated rhomboid family serine protease